MRSPLRSRSPSPPPLTKSRAFCSRSWRARISASSFGGATYPRATCWLVRRAVACCDAGITSANFFGRSAVLRHEHSLGDLHLPSPVGGMMSRSCRTGSPNLCCNHSEPVVATGRPHNGRLAYLWPHGAPRPAAFAQKVLAASGLRHRSSGWPNRWPGRRRAGGIGVGQDGQKLQPWPVELMGRAGAAMYRAESFGAWAGLLGAVLRRSLHGLGRGQGTGGTATVNYNEVFIL